MSTQAPQGPGDALATLPPPAYTPYAAYPYPSYPANARDRGPVSKRQAAWALILAIVPMPVGWLVSIALAITVLRDSRDGRGRERGSALAIVALVIAPLWMALTIVGLVYGGLSGSVSRDGAGHVAASGDALTSSLRTGDCLAQLPQPSRVSRTVPVVPCSTTHVGEVFATFDLATGGYPGDAQVRRLAEGGCVRRFTQAKTGLSQASPRLFYYAPTQASWTAGHRVVCVAAEGTGTAA